VKYLLLGDLCQLLARPVQLVHCLAILLAKFVYVCVSLCICKCTLMCVLWCASVSV